MSSWLVTWFLNKKAMVTVDEVCRQGRFHLVLSNLDLTSIENQTMEKIYNSKVSHLLLNGNKLTDRGIPRDFGFFAQQLSSLSLAQNHLATLPPCICLLKSLKGLNISRNPFTSDELPVVLCELKQLQSLHVNECGIKTLPEDLFHLKELQVLSVRHNMIQVIPPILFYLPKLQWLTLAHNRIRKVPSEVANAKSLVHFNLDYNFVSVLPLSNTWNQMQSLRFLFLKSNQIVIIEALVLELQKIPNLKKVDLSENIMQCREWKKLKNNFVLTPDLKYVPTNIVEIEDIWRREGGLDTVCSKVEIPEVESSTYGHRCSVTDQSGRLTMNLAKEEQRCQSEPKMGQRTRDDWSWPRGKSGSFVLSKNENVLDESLQQSTSARPETAPTPISNKLCSSPTTLVCDLAPTNFEMPARIIRDLTTHPSLLTSNYQIPQVIEEFEEGKSIYMQNTTEIVATTSEFDGNAVLPLTVVPGPPAEVVENLEPPRLEVLEEENIVEDDHSEWEESVDTDDLDDCDPYSDVSDFDEMPFDEVEAKVTLLSVLF